MRDHWNFLIFGISTTLFKSHCDRDVSMNMEQAVVGVSNCVIHSVILYLTTQNLNSSEIYQKIVKTFNENFLFGNYIFNKYFDYFPTDFTTI